MLNKQIFRLAWPNIVTNISIPLLAIVDIGLMGHLGNPNYVGAVGLGSVIFSFIFWMFGFLRMGSSGLTAQAVGRNNIDEAFIVLFRSIVLAFGFGLLLILLQWPVEKIAFVAVNGSTEVENLAKSYFLIRIYAAPATLFIYAITGWLIGMQNARLPMMLTISINVLNILLSYLFISIFHFGIGGVALSNLISQYSGLIIGLLMVRKLYQKQSLRLDYSAVFDRNAFLKFARLNRDIFIRTLCLIFTLTFFTVQSANNSDTLLTVNTLLFQFFYFFSYFTDGLAYAAEALTGKYFGAGDYRMLKALITRIFRWSLLFVAIFSIVYWVAGSYLITLLTDNPAIIHAAQPFIKWIAIIPIASFMAFIWDGVYVGATASVPMRNSMVFSTVVVFLPAYFLLQPYLHNHALWLAMVLFLFSRGVYLGINYKQHILTPIVLQKT